VRFLPGERAAGEGSARSEQGVLSAPVVGAGRARRDLDRKKT
jgi:hypothetical protein